MCSVNVSDTQLDRFPICFDTRVSGCGELYAVVLGIFGIILTLQSPLPLSRQHEQVPAIVNFFSFKTQSSRIRFLGVIIILLEVVQHKTKLQSQV